MNLLFSSSFWRVSKGIVTPAVESVALILLVLLVLSGVTTIQPAHGMGQPPNACNNLYSATVLSASVTYPGGKLDPIAHPNSTIVLQKGQTYNLTVTAQSAARSNASNTKLGTIWYRDNFYGFEDDECYLTSSSASIGPNQKVPLNFTKIPIPPNITPPPINYTVEFEVFDGPSSGTTSPLTFTVQWAAPKSSTTSTSSTPASTVTSVSTVTTTAISNLTTTESAVTTTTVTSSAIVTQPPVITTVTQTPAPVTTTSTGTVTSTSTVTSTAIATSTGTVTSTSTVTSKSTVTATATTTSTQSVTSTTTSMGTVTSTVTVSPPSSTSAASSSYSSSHASSTQTASSPPASGAPSVSSTGTETMDTSTATPAGFDTTTILITGAVAVAALGGIIALAWKKIK